MKTILILHGALGSAAQLQPLTHLFADAYQVHTLDFSGHGSAPMPDAPFSIRLFADDVLAYMSAHGLEKVTIFGYSMGGYVGMYLARHYPEKVARLVTLATKYHWDPATAAKEVKMLDPEVTLAKVPAFAEVLQKRHSDWKTVMHKTAAMMLDLGNDNTLKPADYAAVQAPCLLLLGDHDKMITLNETVEAYKRLPDARLGVLPDTTHPVEKLDLALLKAITARELAV